jgi:hypothetical protein
MLILLGVGGAVALTGVPTPEPGWNTLLGASQVVAASLSGLSTPAIPGAGVSESASLLVLAGGFFTAAVLVRRRG